MYFRVATRKKKSGTYQSLHLVESYRTPDGKVRKKIIINFGPLHRYTKEEIRKIIGELSRFFQLEETARGEEFSFETRQDFGGTYAIFRIWDELGWSRVLRTYLRGRHYEFDVVANCKVLVANRLLDPHGQAPQTGVDGWGPLSWYQGRGCGLKPSFAFHGLFDRAQGGPGAQARLGPHGSFCLDLVFYDLTSCYFEIDQEDRDRRKARGSSLRNYGYDRDRRGCPQLFLGLAMTREGMPLCHWVFPAQTPDRATLKALVKDLKARFPIKRCVVVGDRKASQ